MTVADIKGKAIALASSGGLDSCTIARWQTDQDGKVLSISADIGQPDETNIDDIKTRMLASGAFDAVLVDLKQELAEEAVTMLVAGARYEGGYWHPTGIARYVTTRGLLQEMKKHDIDVLAHGATGPVSYTHLKLPTTQYV